MKHSPARLISFTVMALAINAIGANLALILRLPIYLDTIGSFLSAILLGPWYGLLTAILSALLNWMTTDIYSLFYAPVAVVTSVLAGFLIKKEEQTVHLLWKSLLISLPGTMLSATITLLLFNGITSSGSGIVAQILTSFGLDKTSSLVLVQFLTDYLDRLISLFAVIAIVYPLEKIAPNLFKQKSSNFSLK